HQVHGPEQRRPSYLARDVELIVGDVRDPATVRRALDHVDVVYHLAARVGVALSNYQVAEYSRVNQLGTAVLLEALSERAVRRLVVASSMSIYGEGRYRDAAGGVHDEVRRTRAQLRCNDWEPRGPRGEALTPVPTPEDKPPNLASVYALHKYDQ